MSERVWPDGCPKKSACARHSACMYGCATHKGRPPGDVAAEINAETERREGIRIDPANRLNHMAREIAADSFLVEAIGRWTKQVIAEVVAYEREKHAKALSAAYQRGAEAMKAKAVELCHQQARDWGVYRDHFPQRDAAKECASAIQALQVSDE